MTQDPWKLAKLVTHIQQSLESAGLIPHGLATLERISISPSRLTTDITLIDLCVRSSAMDQTTLDNQKPSPPKPDYQKPSLEIFNRSTSKRSLPISDGMVGWTPSLEQWATLQPLLDGSVGSLDVVMIHPL